MYKNNMRAYRREKGITLWELSSKTGLSAGYLCHLENGSRSNPSLQVMGKISAVLNKTVNEVFFEE